MPLLFASLPTLVNQREVEKESVCHTVRFNSKDDLPITADLYLVPGARGFLVLCHRSHFNRADERVGLANIWELGTDPIAPLGPLSTFAVEYHRIDTGRRGDEQPMSSASTKAQVRYSLRHKNLAH
jgi:hypothetical protein